MYKWHEDYNQVLPDNSKDPVGIVIILGLIASVSHYERESYPKDDMKRSWWNFSILDAIKPIA